MIDTETSNNYLKKKSTMILYDTLNIVKIIIHLGPDNLKVTKKYR